VQVANYPNVSSVTPIRYSLGMNSFTIKFEPGVAETIRELGISNARKQARVKNALERLAQNPRHNGLHTHTIRRLTGPNGAQLWQSYVDNGTPDAWRIMWCYGPERAQITVVRVGPHL
jgi:hypothetical protein